MPTGYTADIPSGISFRDFAMQCARAFGACVTLRDEPLSAEIPEEFRPHPYNKDEAARLRSELSEIYSLTNAEADERAAELHREAEHERVQRLAEKEQKRQAYLAMLECARAWTPPTADHQGLKDFMVEQIEKTIEFDCSTSSYDEPTQPMTGSQWRAERIETLQREIVYHDKAYAEEAERAAGRTDWVHALRNSLPEDE